MAPTCPYCGEARWEAHQPQRIQRGSSHPQESSSIIAKLISLSIWIAFCLASATFLGLVALEMANQLASFAAVLFCVGVGVGGVGFIDGLGDGKVCQIRCMVCNKTYEAPWKN